MFGKVWYEGYPQPEYVWQSTGATDDFEPKISLVPLVFGTIKGTVYALMFAIPLAVFGALYTSQFVHPRIRAKIKPTVEIMAALPSVVIGFVAACLGPPRAQLVAFSLTMNRPAAVAPRRLFWRAAEVASAPASRQARVLVILPLLLLEVSGFFQRSRSVDLFFPGARQWLSRGLGLTYDPATPGGRAAWDCGGGAHLHHRGDALSAFRRRCRLPLSLGASRSRRPCVSSSNASPGGSPRSGRIRRAVGET